MFKKTLIGLAVAGLAAVSGTAMAGVSISTAGGTVNGVSQLDWSAANVLAVGGQTAVNNFIALQTAQKLEFLNQGFYTGYSVQQSNAINLGLGSRFGAPNDINALTASLNNSGTGFTAYSQGRLANFNDGANKPILGNGLNSLYEVTYVVGFEERVIGINGNQAVFGFGGFSDKPVNYFQIWYDTSKNSSDLAGTGFEDGKLVFEGKVSPKDGLYNSNFTNNTGSTGPGVAIDNFGGVSAGWAGYNSVQGAGITSDLDLVVTPFTVNQDYNFFLSQITELELTNLSAQLEFRTVDPSLAFETAGVADTRPLISTMNGRNGTSILFQTDANSPINGVPEPGSIALLSAAALAAGVVRRRKA